MGALLESGKYKKKLIDGKMKYFKKSTLVYVHDLLGLYRSISVFRGNRVDYPISWMMDDGRKVFKVMWNIVNTNTKKLCSVDTLQILAEIDGIQKSRDTVQRVMKYLKFDEFVYKSPSTNFTTYDYKIYQMEYGILGKNSKYPSPFCTYDSRNQQLPCELRTKENMKINWEKFKTGEFEPKQCFGVEAEPRWAMWDNIESGKLVPTPPPLHTMLGQTNAVFKRIMDIASDEQKTDLYNNWMFKCRISKQAYWAGTFQGNQCQAIIRNREIFDLFWYKTC